MDLGTILMQYLQGQLSISQVQKEISIHSIEKVGQNLANLDVKREFRRGIPEVVLGEGKTSRDIVKIVLSALQVNSTVVVSRIRREELPTICRALKRRRNQVEVGKNSTTILAKTSFVKKRSSGGKIGIISAGTSDMAVAEEARLMAEAMGCSAIVHYDVGIAGIHRLFPALQEMIAAGVDAIVVVAGMEGALASVVSAMVNVPVVGVPTSVGYGFGSAGLAALSCMLQSCTIGLAVFNIDNGIGAGAFAALIANRMASNSNRIKIS
jgi:pyridinium-3,5-biscarboxylic acid mononucleotide synthase